MCNRRVKVAGVGCEQLRVSMHRLKRMAGKGQWMAVVNGSARNQERGNGQGVVMLMAPGWKSVVGLEVMFAVEMNDRVEGRGMEGLVASWPCNET